jgi:hypothetical protein
MSAVPFAVWLEKNCLAQPPRVRPNVMSAAGQSMLNIYANAVQTMTSTPEADPRGWLFQWYIHGVRDDRSKASEITRIYPTPSPRRTLAQQAWETCQAHHGGDIEDFFLPWHRMYLFFFERIIQKVSNNPSFALPYWDPTDTSSPSGPRLPNRFINPANASNSLFRPNRRAVVNAGDPIATPAFKRWRSAGIQLKPRRQFPRYGPRARWKWPGNGLRPVGSKRSDLLVAPLQHRSLLGKLECGPWSKQSQHRFVAQQDVCIRR